VQPRADEQDQHEKNCPPVQAYCEPVERWSPRVDRRLPGAGAGAQRRKVHLTRSRLVEQRIRLHNAAPLFRYLTEQDCAVRGFIPLSHHRRGPLTRRLNVRF
jgi:hypothetical protein